MAKGNSENLLKNEDLTPEERRENASKAGKASGEARAKNASIRKILLKNFHDAEIGTDEHGNPLTGAEFTANQIVVGVKKGNIKFIEMYLAMIGQKPADNVNVTGEIKNKELESIMQQLGGGDNGKD